MSVKLTPLYDGASYIFDRPYLALVEGRDDQAVIKRQIELIGMANEWQIHSMEGNRTNWGSVLDVALSADFPVFGRGLALIQDADVDAAAVLTRLQALLRPRAFPVPGAHGEVVKNERWRSGVYVFPDGSSTGALETLLLNAVDSQRADRARDYVAAIAAEFGPLKHQEKNVILAYLAGQYEHVRSLPVAVGIDDIFPPESSAFEPLRDFLRRLAEPAA